MSQTLRAGSLTIDETLAADGQPAIYFRSTRDSGREFFSLQAAQGVDQSIRINKHNAAGEIVATGVLKDTLTYPVDDSPTFAAVTVTGNVTVAGSVNSKLDVVRLTAGGPITAAHFGKYLYAAPGDWSAGITLPLVTATVPGTTITIINKTGDAINEHTTGSLLIADAVATFIWHREGPTGPAYWITNLSSKAVNSLSVGKLNADPGVAFDVVGAIKASTTISAPVIEATTTLSSVGRTNLAGPTMIGGDTGGAYAYTLDVLGTGRTTGAMTVDGRLTANGQTDLKGLLTADAGATVTGNLTVDGETLYVDSASNQVGIGTLSPQGKLHVTGDVRIGTQTSALVLGRDDVYNRGTVKVFDINGGYRPLALNPDGAAVTIGNVTVATAAALDVAGSIHADHLEIGPTGNSYGTLGWDGLYVPSRVRTGAVIVGDVQQIDAANIGGSMRVERLNITGDNFADAQPLAIYKTGATTGVVRYEGLAGGNTLEFQNGAVTPMRFQADGRIGILTTGDAKGQLHIGFGMTAAQDWIFSQGSVEPTSSTAPGVGYYSSLLAKGMSINPVDNMVTVYTPWNNAFGAGILSGSGGTMDFLTAMVPTPDHADIVRAPKDLMRMRITADGHVGIGTGTPAQTLDVSGTVSASAYTFTGVTAPTITYRDIPVDQGAPPGGATEMILFHGSDGSGPDRITVRAPEISLQTYDGGIMSADNAAGANDRVRIQSNGTVTFNNNVNIGIKDAPSPAGLNIYGSASLFQSLSVANDVSIGGSLTCGSIVVSGTNNLSLLGLSTPIIGNTSEVYLIDNTVITTPNITNTFRYNGRKKHVRIYLVGGGGGGGSGGALTPSNTGNRFDRLVGGGGGGSGYISQCEFDNIINGALFDITLGGGGNGGTAVSGNNTGNPGSNGGTTKLTYYTQSPDVYYTYTAPGGGGAMADIHGGYGMGGNGWFGGGGSIHFNYYYEDVYNAGAARYDRYYYFDLKPVSPGTGASNAIKYYNNISSTYTQNGLAGFTTNNNSTNITNPIYGEYIKQDVGQYSNLYLFGGKGGGGGGLGGYDGYGVNNVTINGTTAWFRSLPGGGGGGQGGGNGGMYRTLPSKYPAVNNPTGQDGVRGGGGGGGAAYPVPGFPSTISGGAGGRGGDGYVLMEFY